MYFSQVLCLSRYGYSMHTERLLLISMDSRAAPCSVISAKRVTYSLQIEATSFGRLLTPDRISLAWYHRLQNEPLSLKHSNAVLLISPKLLCPYSWQAIPWPWSNSFSGAWLNSAPFRCAVTAWPATPFASTPANWKNYSSWNKTQRASRSGHKDFSEGNKHIIKPRDNW